MEDLIIKARIKHKYKTAADWEAKKDFIPKAGELIIYDSENVKESARFKFGNGVNTVNELPFADEQLRTLINEKLSSDTLQAAINNALEQAKNSGEFDGANGTTFTPVMSGKGDLSWVNNGGLPNPAPVNILGFVYKGSNPLAALGLEQDTRQFWAGQGSGYWWISGYDNLKEQPSQYGYLLNMCYGTGETYQVFFGAALNIICVRSGGAGSVRDDGWYRANSSTDTIWRELVFADTLQSTN